MAGDIAMSRTPAQSAYLRGLRALPYAAFHSGAVKLSRLEDQFVHPLLSRRLRSHARSALRAVDGDGALGLEEVAKEHARYTRHVWAADSATIALHVADHGFRERALTIDNESALQHAVSGGRGAIIAGLHLGPHATLPLILAQLGYKVAVAGSASILNKGDLISRACLPHAAERLSWLPLDDPLSLLRARSSLRSGSLVLAYVEQILDDAVSAAADVTLFGRRVRTSAMLPYLAAVTSSPIVVASIVSENGPRFMLRFEPPLPPPTRDDSAIQATLQELFRITQARALERPEQWLLWDQLASVVKRLAVKPAHVSFEPA